MRLVLRSSEAALRRLLTGRLAHQRFPPVSSVRDPVGLPRDSGG
ncbi:hypothetical protein CU044_0754 [Streptomyces sp. L-9-10]|nr:hypothetical protein CU044_0754 [Streptomyces sp. L-9-10]